MEFQKQNQRLKEGQERIDKIEKVFGKRQHEVPEKNLSQSARKEKNEFDILKERSHILYSWKASEFEKNPKTHRHYLIIYGVIFSLVALGLFTENLLMSILFIMFGVIFYLMERRKPELYDFAISSEGVFAQDQLYEYSSLESFWIFYEPDGVKELSLKSKRNFLPCIYILLGDADPVKLRKALINFIPEVEQDMTLVGTLERFL